MFTTTSGLETDGVYEPDTDTLIVTPKDSFTIELSEPLELDGITLPQGTWLEHAEGGQWSVIPAAKDTGK